MLNKIYQLYPKAMTDLENIYLYGRSEFGLKKADSYIKNMEIAFQNIANNPDCARQCFHIRNKLMAWNVESHVIFFKKTKKGIVIIRVLHQSMDCTRHL